MDRQGPAFQGQRGGQRHSWLLLGIRGGWCIAMEEPPIAQSQTPRAINLNPILIMTERLHHPRSVPLVRARALLILKEHPLTKRQRAEWS